MGSWSVYCEISNITISYNDECVLVPLRENSSLDSNWCCATPPIFGRYNDYGGIEQIEKTIGTKLIEDYFGVSIDDFCTFLIDGVHTYDRDEAKAIEASTEHYDEAKGLRFMWVCRKVWDFMTRYVGGDKGICGILGRDGVLKELGFTYVGENNDTRYNQTWERDGIEFHSDGNWLHTSSGRLIYGLKPSDEFVDGYLSTMVKITDEDVEKFNRYSWNLWRLFGKVKAQEALCRSVGVSSSHLSWCRIFEDESTPISIGNAMLNDLENYGDYLADYLSVNRNMYSMSKQYKPFSLYSTPQYGEYRDHQAMLEKFCEINKQYALEEDE